MPVQPPMPTTWVEAIIAKLTVLYGSAFSSQYEAIQRDVWVSTWADALKYVKSDAVLYAFEHLPERPPNAVEFKRIAMDWKPPQPAYQLPAPNVSREQRMRNIEQLKKVRDAFTSTTRSNPKAWAWKLKEREEAGESLTQAQRTMWRAAIGDELQRVHGPERPA